MRKDQELDKAITETARPGGGQTLAGGNEIERHAHRFAGWALISGYLDELRIARHRRHSRDNQATEALVRLDFPECKAAAATRAPRCE